MQHRLSAYCHAVQFILIIAIALLTLQALAQNQGDAPVSTNLAKERTLYVVSTAHLDTQWLWTIQDTIREYLPDTLRRNFALFAQFPDYTFSFEGAFRYQLMQEYYPQDFARLKNYVAQGRWRVAGTSVDAGDVNIASPESLIRQSLYGSQYFKKTFGKTSCDYFLPDCFGFGYAYPSVAAHCGVRGFSTAKLGWGSADQVPFDIGRWVGPDGKGVVAVLKPGGYGTTLTGDPRAKWQDDAAANGRKTGVPVAYKYIGVGDCGGAPDTATVRWLQQAVADKKNPVRVISAGSDQLFRDLTPQQIAGMPAYNSELLMATHGTGCYTSQAAMKRWNRENEQLGDAAERISVVADWLGGAGYPKAKLTEAWTRFLWHQFHDDLTGTSLPTAYLFSWNDENISLNQFAEVMTNATGAVTRALDTRAQGIPLVVVNPLSIAREDIVTAQVTFPHGVPKAVRIFTPAGVEVPAQLAAVSGNTAAVTFLATAPSLGFAVYDVRGSTTPCHMLTGLSISAQHLENARYRVQLDAHGDVAGIVDKALHKEILAAPMRIGLFSEDNARWPAWEISYPSVTRPARAYVEQLVSVKVVENGPARVTLEIFRRGERSIFVQQLSLAAGSAGKRLEITTNVKWDSRDTFAKAIFPFNAANTKATYDLGLGVIERGNNTATKYEVPAQQWADLTATDGSYGVAVLNDGKVGWDKPSDNILRLTLLRSPATTDRESFDFGNNYYQKMNDIGTHNMRYAIISHAGDWRDGQVVWEGARFNQPLTAFQTVAHAGKLAKSFSFAQVSSPQVAIRAVKQAEDSREIVVRLQELTGKPAEQVTLSFAGRVLNARAINGIEEPIGPAMVKDGRLVVSMTAYEPKTFAITLATPSAPLPKPTSTPVALPYNIDVVSLDGEANGGNLDGQGHSIAGELFPATLTGEDIAFTLGPVAKGQRNAVACAGQTITFNNQRANRLYLLMAARNGDRQEMFLVDGRPVVLQIQDATEFIGQWDSRYRESENSADLLTPKYSTGDPVNIGLHPDKRYMNTRMATNADEMTPAYTKRQPIAWVGTHRHTADGNNDPYLFTYLFKYRIDLPASARSLTLPNDKNILVFAMSLANNANDVTVPTGVLYNHPFAKAGLP